MHIIISPAKNLNNIIPEHIKPASFPVYLKESKRLIAALKKNDEVVTSGGIHGTIVNVKDKTVTLRIDDNVRMEVQRGSISTIKKKREG